MGLVSYIIIGILLDTDPSADLLNPLNGDTTLDGGCSNMFMFLGRLVFACRRCEFVNGPNDELKILDEAVGGETQQSNSGRTIRPVTHAVSADERYPRMGDVFAYAIRVFPSTTTVRSTRCPLSSRSTRITRRAISACSADLKGIRRVLIGEQGSSMSVLRRGAAAAGAEYRLRLVPIVLVLLDGILLVGRHSGGRERTRGRCRQTSSLYDTNLSS